MNQATKRLSILLVIIKGIFLFPDCGGMQDESKWEIIMSLFRQKIDRNKQFYQKRTFFKCVFLLEKFPVFIEGFIKTQRR